MKNEIAPDGATARHGRPPALAAPELAGLDGIALDITERKEMAEELRRTQNLDAIGHLTGGIAHDFNNLLTIIVGNLELIEDAAGDGDRRQCGDDGENPLFASRHIQNPPHRITQFGFSSLDNLNYRALPCRPCDKHRHQP